MSYKRITSRRPVIPLPLCYLHKVLVQMSKMAENKRKISGLRLERWAPPISHLLFADDSMLYYKGSEDELNQIVQVLHNYNLASGQRINDQKSSFYFDKNIPRSRREEMQS